MIIIIIIINTFLYGAFTKLNAPYNDVQTEDKSQNPYLIKFTIMLTYKEGYFLPHLKGLPHLSGVSHLHVNRPLNIRTGISMARSYSGCCAFLYWFPVQFYLRGID